MLKKQVKILTAFLVVVLIFCFALPHFSANAASVETINEDQVWRKQWSAPESKTVIFSPTKSGFYSLNIIDYNLTSGVFVEITNLTTGQPFDCIYKKIDDEPYNGEKAMMVAGHEYELVCYYSGNDLYDRLQADISICFKTVDFTPYQLTECDIYDSRVMVNFEDGVKEWIRFTANKSGDYSLNFLTGIDGLIKVYNAQTAELVDSRYTVFSEQTTGAYAYSSKLTYKFEKNTEYYFCMEEYRMSSTRISISKNEKDIKDITIKPLNTDIYGIFSPETINNMLFDYNIIYTDNSREAMSYNNAMVLGIELPYIEYLGTSLIIADSIWMQSGKQPVAIVYNGNVKIIYIDVISLTDLLISSNVKTYTANEALPLEFSDYEEHETAWLINVNNTGIYSIDVTTDFDNILDYYTLELVDEKNNTVKSVNQNDYSWPMIAGQNYAVYLKHRYSEEKFNVNTNIYFYLCDGQLYPDVPSDAWYNDAITYTTGSGIMTGYGNGSFGAADGIQRQDFLVMLARLDGVDLYDYEYDSQFPDVPHGSYYEAAINWGYDMGIVSGYQNGNFGVGDKITREQIVTFLYRYANYRYADTTYTNNTENTVNSKFKDYNSVNDYAKEPMLWAIEKGVIKGKTSNTITPYGNALRCEIAQIMYNIFKNSVF